VIQNKVGVNQGLKVLILLERYMPCFLSNTHFSEWMLALVKVAD
jgi:hypothetical protein